VAGQSKAVVFNLEYAYLGGYVKTSSQSKRKTETPKPGTSSDPCTDDYFRMNEYNNPSFATMFESARSNIVANEGLLYSFIVTCATGCTHPI
jgi:hypothetical protein